LPGLAQEWEWVWLLVWRYLFVMISFDRELMLTVKQVWWGEAYNKKTEEIIQKEYSLFFSLLFTPELL